MDIVEDTVAIATMTDVTEEAGETTTVEEDTVVTASTVITGVAPGLAVVPRDTAVVVPHVIAVAAVLAALDIVEGIMMIVVPLTVGGRGIMIGDMSVPNVGMEMGGKYYLRRGAHFIVWNEISERSKLLPFE